MFSLFRIFISFVFCFDSSKVGGFCGWSMVEIVVSYSREVVTLRSAGSENEAAIGAPAGFAWIKITCIHIDNTTSAKLLYNQPTRFEDRPDTDLHVSQPQNHTHYAIYRGKQIMRRKLIMQRNKLNTTETKEIQVIQQESNQNCHCFCSTLDFASVYSIWTMVNSILFCICISDMPLF